MKLKNLILALKEQGPPKRAFRNFFITGNAWGLFHINSHMRRDTRKLKVMYNTKETAQKAADSMKKKMDKHFSVYKCIYCDGYHLGKNRIINKNVMKYNKEEIIELLKQQRELCYKNAKIETFEYVNPYSESDGEITTRISETSIIDSILVI